MKRWKVELSQTGAYIIVYAELKSYVFGYLESLIGKEFTIGEVQITDMDGED